MSGATEDLNQVISSAVQARIETEVATALASSELIVQYVSAALHQKIEVKDRDSYRTRESTYLREAIDNAIRGATKAALAKTVEAEMPAIEQAITTELRKNVKDIAKTLAGKVAEVAASPYGVTVELKYPKRGE